MTTSGRESSKAMSTTNIEKNQVLQKQGYTLLRMIGEGSYAKVYESEYEDATTKARIRLACKIVDASEASKNFLTKFFPREMEIMSKVNHANVIRVHSILMRKETYFIFMEFAAHGDLLEFIKAHGAVKELRAKIWFGQILQALKYLHDKGIAHRDMKCENVLLSRNYNVKLSDFGFARYITNKKGEYILSSTFCGSIAYSPPEIIKGVKYDPVAVDLWSIGVILFIMLNKAMPFDDKDLKKLYADQIERKWKVRTKLKNVLSQDVQRLLVILLEPSPKKRLPVEKIMNHKWLQSDSPEGGTTPMIHVDQGTSTSFRNTITIGVPEEIPKIQDIDTGKDYPTNSHHHHHHHHHHDHEDADEDAGTEQRLTMLRKSSKKETDILSQTSIDEN